MRCKNNGRGDETGTRLAVLATVGDVQCETLGEDEGAFAVCIPG